MQKYLVKLPLLADLIFVCDGAQVSLLATMPRMFGVSSIDTGSAQEGPPTMAFCSTWIEWLLSLKK